MAVFVSGSGRTLENFFRCIDAGALRAEIVLVVASKECRGAEIGRARGVETRVIPWREHTKASVEAMLRGAGAHWCVLAGYLHLLPVPASFAGRVVNIHPALLPKFGGAGMYGHRVHQAVLDAGETRTGCTVHLCDDEYDRGAIVAQASCEVLPGDTADTLAARVFALETALYPAALTKLFGGSTPSEP
jgi:phosphoribosylglycinamide formyltransferase-1